MGESINLEIITPESTVVNEEITDLYIPAYYGEAGILENHLPYISLLKFGEVSYTDMKNKRHYMYLEGGVLEVKGNYISIISDIVIRGEDIDAKDIEEKLKEAESKIGSASEGEMSPDDLSKELILKKKLLSQKNIMEKTR